MQAGCDAYIAKPLDTRTLAAQISRFLGDGEDDG
jgi:DNA-binding response OmpR family regulator